MPGRPADSNEVEAEQPQRSESTSRYEYEQADPSRAPSRSHSIQQQAGGAPGRWRRSTCSSSKPRIDALANGCELDDVTDTIALAATRSVRWARRLVTAVPTARAHSSLVSWPTLANYFLHPLYEGIVQFR